MEHPESERNTLASAVQYEKFFTASESNNSHLGQSALSIRSKLPARVTVIRELQSFEKMF
jgi:hypothetical protein